MIFQRKLDHLRNDGYLNRYDEGHQRVFYEITEKGRREYKKIDETDSSFVNQSMKWLPEVARVHGPNPIRIEVVYPEPIGGTQLIFGLTSVPGFSLKSLSKKKDDEK